MRHRALHRAGHAAGAGLGMPATMGASMDTFRDLLAALLAFAAPVVPGVLGRWLYHFEQVRRGRRPAIGWLLLWENAIAIPMGYVGLGVADWMGLTGNAAFAVSIAIAYNGPRVLEIACDRWLAKLPVPKG